MNEIRLTEQLPDSVVDRLCGSFLTVEKHASVVVTAECRVLKPSGAPLFVLLKRAVPDDLCRVAFDSLSAAAAPATNRGIAAGKNRDGVTRVQRVRKDGTRSKTTVSAVPANSGIVGYFDRYPRMPYCRQTAYSLEHPDRFRAALPFVEHVDKVFREHLPDRHAAQMAAVNATHPDWILGRTAFTTITVNRNFRTAVHKDAGDLKEGFGVLTVLRRGVYSGGILIFPKFRAGVEFDHGDVLLADVHEWHGNSPLVGDGDFDRVSCVLYYRDKMMECASGLEERAREERSKRRSA